jgi:nitrate reductase gamma subunit
MFFYKLIYGIYPYIALSVFLLGSLVRFDREQFSWKADSSQLLDRKQLRLGSNLFHVGVLALFAGHFIGLLTPHSLFLALGIPDLVHQYVAIIAGSVFGLVCMIGGVILWRRRMFNRRIRATSRFMDIFILDWLLVTLSIGLITIPFSIKHAIHGDAGTMVFLAEWAQSIITLQPKPDVLVSIELIYRIHMFFGMTVFLLFPFSRLVHIWSAPFGYLMRPYQIVRKKYVQYR